MRKIFLNDKRRLIMAIVHENVLISRRIDVDTTLAKKKLQWLPQITATKKTPHRPVADIKFTPFAALVK